MSGKKPHVVIFNPDQWRGDVLGHMGNAGAVTPHLDRLAAEEGMSFRNAFCQNPICTPSRCSFMSGWYTHVRGHRTLFHMMRPDEPVLLKTLKDNGYYVWWGGKNDLVPAQNGFEKYCDVKFKAQSERLVKWRAEDAPAWRGEPGSDTYYSFHVGKLEKGDAAYFRDFDWAMVEGAIEMIENYDGSKPLCLYLPLTYPHPPYAVEEPWYGMIDAELIPRRNPTPPGWKGKPAIMSGVARRQNLQNYGEERFKRLRATYYGMCARVDHQFGLVRQALVKKGMWDETMLFFFSDHGDYTGDYGLVEKTQNTFEDCLTRVPFLVKPPRGVACRPGVSEAMVELVDMVGTVEAVTGIQMSHDHFGRSLLPVLSGEAVEHRDAVFCQGGRREGEPQARERESNCAEGNLYWPRVSLQEFLPEHSYGVMCRTREYKLVKRLYEDDELYDLKKDPGEMVNLVHDPAYAAIKMKLEQRVLRFYMETCDVVPRETDKR